MSTKTKLFKKSHETKMEEKKKDTQNDIFFHFVIMSFLCFSCEVCFSK